jgi:dTDP-4-dehydrorhamnose reductase
MKILITGAYGQLGSELKEIEMEYPNYHFDFTDVDSLDITNESDVESYFARNTPNFVVNCAAYTAVDKAEKEAVIAEKVNSLAPKLLAKNAKKVGAKVIHVSTDYVFSGDANQPYTENDEINPQGIYGKTKLQGEIDCLKENPDSVIIRTSWLYSEFGNNFVKTMLRLGKERDSLNVVVDQIGTPTYAGDLAKAIVAIIKGTELNKETFVPGIYHFSNEGVASWYDFALAVFEMEKIQVEVAPVSSDKFPTPAKRPHFSVLNKSKIKDIFGIDIPYWRDSLRICLEKINNN